LKKQLSVTMFEQFEQLPSDAILGISAAFKADERADKIDLGVGVYKDEKGDTPIMKAVASAAARVTELENSKSYLSPSGVSGFISAISALVFGDNNPAIREGRIAGIQSPGGSGALRLGAEVLARRGIKKIHIGTPSWANHIPLLSSAGIEIVSVPYYDMTSAAIDFESFVAALKDLEPEDVVLFHGVCHNPTGADLSDKQWDIIIDLINDRGFLPFIDTAYHGFSRGLLEDVEIIRKMSARIPELLVSYSCSKNFGLYRERVGTILVMAQKADHAMAVESHLVQAARRLYSMPPAFGAQIVTMILQSMEFSEAWRTELSAMTKDINDKRMLLAKAAHRHGIGNDFGFISSQRGLFSLLPLNPDQVMALRQDHAIYMAPDGRINFCGLNPANIDKFCDAVKAV